MYYPISYDSIFISCSKIYSVEKQLSCVISKVIIIVFDQFHSDSRIESFVTRFSLHSHVIIVHFFLGLFTSRGVGPEGFNDFT